MSGELILGGKGKDTLTGGEGNDIILGGKGKDTLIYQVETNGEPTSDIYDGGKGKDTLRIAISCADYDAVMQERILAIKS